LLCATGSLKGFFFSDFVKAEKSGKLRKLKRSVFAQKINNNKGQKRGNERLETKKKTSDKVPDGF
jgi:hypothetical protein